MSAQLFVIAGPSTSGQSTVVNELLHRHNDWATVYSYTTRAPRIQEGDEKKYYFVTKLEFDKLLKSGEIIEYQEYAGNWYGTSRKSLKTVINQAAVVLLSVQIEGLNAFRKLYPGTVGIYIKVKLADARARMEADHRRDAMTKTEKEARLKLIKQLNDRSNVYDYVVESVQGSIIGTVDQVEDIIANHIG